jgi:hypothetical protein
VSSPAILKPLASLNRGKLYAEQVKPFDFLNTCHVRPLGHSIGVDAEHFHLIAPFEKDATKWDRILWTDQYSGERFRISTTGDSGTRRTARVKTYGEVLEDYKWHPEAKCADAQGAPCGKGTVGLLQRRHVRIERIRYIGKESNQLEEVEAGIVHASSDVYTEYPDPKRDPWETDVRPVLAKIPLKVFEKLTGKARRVLIDAKRSRRKPRAKTRELLAEVSRKLGLT